MIKGFTFLYWSRFIKLKKDAIFHCLVWALGISLATSFVLVLWVILMPFNSYYFAALLQRGTLLSVFAGGFVAGFLAKNMGWFHGGLVGFLYGIIFLFLVLVGNYDLFCGLDLAERIGFSALCGIAGGVMGVNLPVPAAQRRLKGIKKLTDRSARWAPVPLKRRPHRG